MSRGGRENSLGRRNEDRESREENGPITYMGSSMTREAAGCSMDRQVTSGRRGVLNMVFDVSGRE